MHKKSRQRERDFRWIVYLTSFEVDGGRHDVVRYLVEKKAETNWIVPSSVLWMFRLAKLKALFYIHGSFFRVEASLSICEDIVEFIWVILLLTSIHALDGLSFMPAARNEDNDQFTVQHCAAFQGAFCRECCIAKWETRPKSANRRRELYFQIQFKIRVCVIISLQKALWGKFRFFFGMFEVTLTHEVQWKTGRFSIYVYMAAVQGIVEAIVGMFIA